MFSEANYQPGTFNNILIALYRIEKGLNQLFFFSLSQEIKEQEVVDKVMETLDEDGDGECDFQEFMAFVSMVTTACHEFFEHE